MIETKIDFYINLGQLHKFSYFNLNVNEPSNIEVAFVFHHSSNLLTNFSSRELEVLFFSVVVAAAVVVSAVVVVDVVFESFPSFFVGEKSFFNKAFEQSSTEFGFR